MSTNQNEATLFEVFQPLVRRWKLLLAGVIAGVLVAAVITVLSKKQYETSMLLMIGAVMDKQIEDTNALVEIINSDSFHRAVASRIALSNKASESTQVIRAETNLTRYSPIVDVMVRAGTPESAVQLAKTVFEVVNERHKPMFDGKMEYYIEYNKMLSEKIKTFEDDVQALKQDLSAMNSKSDVSSRMLLQSRIGDRETQSLTLRRELREMLAYSATVHSHPTVMVSTPVLPGSPAKPNLRLNLAIAFFVSLFVMISVIFIADQYQKTPLRT